MNRWLPWTLLLVQGKNNNSKMFFISYDVLKFKQTLSSPLLLKFINYKFIKKKIEWYWICVLQSALRLIMLSKIMLWMLTERAFTLAPSAESFWTILFSLPKKFYWFRNKYSCMIWQLAFGLICVELIIEPIKYL